MKLEEVCVIAASRKVNTDNLSKAELIRAIQIEEGNFDCYSSAHEGECDQIDCLWREDCLDAAQPGRAS